MTLKVRRLVKELSVGVVVVLEGLANSMYNGQYARVLTKMMLDGRQKIRLEPSMKTIFVSPLNMKALRMDREGKSLPARAPQPPQPAEQPSLVSPPLESAGCNYAGIVRRSREESVKLEETKHALAATAAARIKRDEGGKAAEASEKLDDQKQADDAAAAARIKQDERVAAAAAEAVARIKREEEAETRIKKAAEKQRPTAARAAPVEAARKWCCPRCTLENFGKDHCQACGSARLAQQPTQQQAPQQQQAPAQQHTMQAQHMAQRGSFQQQGAQFLQQQASMPQSTPTPAAARRCVVAKGKGRQLKNVAILKSGGAAVVKPAEQKQTQFSENPPDEETESPRRELEAISLHQSVGIAINL